MRASVPRRWKAPRFGEVVSPSREGGRTGLGEPEERVSTSSRDRHPGATEVSEVRPWRSARNKTPRANLERSAEAVGRRETPDSPVSWPEQQARRQGRGASLEEMPGSARGAGARSQQWEAEVGRTHRAQSFAASRKTDCRSGGLARSKLCAADATHGRSSKRGTASGGVEHPRGNSRVESATKEHAEAAPERIGVRAALSAVKRAGLLFDSVPCRKASGRRG